MNEHCRMDRLSVRSADEAAELSFQFVGPADGYRVEIEAGDCRGAVNTGLGWSTLHTFIDSIAKDWRGWEGPKELHALPPGSVYALPVFRIEAMTDGAGHFTLIAELGSPHLGIDPATQPFDTHVGAPDSTKSGAWRQRVVLVLETWQLDDLALQAADLTKNQPAIPY